MLPPTQLNCKRQNSKSHLIKYLRTNSQSRYHPRGNEKWSLNMHASPHQSFTPPTSAACILEEVKKHGAQRKHAQASEIKTRGKNEREKQQTRYSDESVFFSWNKSSLAPVHSARSFFFSFHRRRGAKNKRARIAFYDRIATRENREQFSASIWSLIIENVCYGLLLFIVDGSFL